MDEWSSLTRKPMVRPTFVGDVEGEDSEALDREGTLRE